MKALAKTLYTLSRKANGKGVEKTPAAFAVSMLPDGFDETEETWANGEQFEAGDNAFEAIASMLKAGDERATFDARVSLTLQDGAVRFLVVPAEVDNELRATTEEIVKTQKIPPAQAYIGQLLTRAVAEKVIAQMPEAPGDDNVVVLQDRGGSGEE
jgi:hypothetical protein